MKPSVARKLNEKIRALESELEELRSNKKVKELEKKVQVRGTRVFGEAGSAGEPVRQASTSSSAQGGTMQPP
jgi:hypothetical protein